MLLHTFLGEWVGGGWLAERADIITNSVQLKWELKLGLSSAKILFVYPEYQWVSYQYFCAWSQANKKKMCNFPLTWQMYLPSSCLVTLSITSLWIPGLRMPDCGSETNSPALWNVSTLKMLKIAKAYCLECKPRPRLQLTCLCLTLALSCKSH